MLEINFQFYYNFGLDLIFKIPILIYILKPFLNVLRFNHTSWLTTKYSALLVLEYSIIPSCCLKMRLY
jgi:hypothetical protein